MKSAVDRPAVLPAAPVLHPPVNLLVARFEELAARGLCQMAGEAGSFCLGRTVHHLPRVIYRAANAVRPLRIGIFTGLRGNLEGGLALLQFLESLAERPWRAAGYELWLYPLCNPTGHEDGEGTNRRGAALDSDFWKASPEPEIMLLERELREQQFQAVLTLHTDAHYADFTGSFSGGEAARRVFESGLALAGFVLRRPGLQLPWPAGALSGPPQGKGRLVSLRFGAPRQVPMSVRTTALEAALGAVLASARHYLDPL
jgi:murein peptide amidase A